MNIPPLTLASPVEALKGIGNTKKALLERLGITTVSELLCYFPRDYLSTRILPLSQGEDGLVHLFSLELLSHPHSAYLPGGRHMVNIQAGDDSGRVTLCFLNQPYAAKSLQKGQKGLFLGRLSGYNGKLWLFSPGRLSAPPQGALLPLYPKTKGLNDKFFRSCLEQVLSLCEKLPDPLPQSLREQNALPSFGDTVKALHAPEDPSSLEQAKRRLLYEQLLRYALKTLRFETELLSHKAAPFAHTELSDFWKLLPFSPTECQKRAAEEIARDLGPEGNGRAMSRLLQGDVGSGKTAVAAAACWLCVQNGFNAVIMAPTQILAKQHYDFFSKLFASTPIQVAFLSGSSTAKERQEFNRAFEAGTPVIAIGTHALLEEKAKMKNLALAVTDEQQRFGVNQRALLMDRCRYPNSLVMSATPIPRSLALFLFSRERISVLDQLPPGRKEVKTYLIGEDKRARMTDFLHRQLQEGNRAYVVCPLIEEDEDGADVKSAAEICHSLQAALPQHRIALLHGRMKDEEKNRIMAEFQRGEQEVLVSTTVIEVGVNVPEANLMIIENAERFGLSQLHQLRGRVGRGSAQAHCILMTPRRDVASLKRLKLLTQTSAGFAISEYDLSHRGPGDFFGTRQSGKQSEVFSLPHSETLLEDVKKDALRLLEEEKEAADALLAGQSAVYLS